MKALPILMYHHVSPEPGLVTISPNNFAAQMAWLAANDYHTIGSDDLERFLEGNSLPERAVMLTFDDGYLDNYVHAYPTLQKHGLHAVIFVVTNWVGNGPPRATCGEPRQPILLNHRDCQERIRNGCSDDAIMRWSEVEATRDAGVFEFHSHTASHTRWDKVCVTDEEKIRALSHDLELSATTLAAKLGAASKHLCWPQGYFDDDYLAVASRLGFTHLYTTQPGSATRNSTPTSLPRVVVKDKGATWLANRIRLYRSPTLARWYGALKSR
ncbi:polysaccharide deacetylase family protein [Rhodocyclus tenuis]|uniref:Polysaccharide deacetylase family protein n=1 Tax=Rhodocyclus gracilis TaxID=2929842 RepID=A0ABX0WKA6_9RHOO|nr:polysaccharide deacetylase family protein [Rhodocyclus gracilis]MRD74005.1 polysaccharide deacetylase family protein [Rhodocyclus gracilis]NJA89987.1 polysaccharide deacetylase family protein [Rhodocyclus gracilis]